MVISNPLVVGVLGLLFFASLILHGTVIWEDPLRQGLALFVAAVALTCVVAALRKGAFAPQWLIEIRHFPEDSDRAEVAVACSGKAVVVEITCQLTDGTERKIRSNSPLTDFGTYSSLIFNLPDRPVSSLEFAAHRVTAEFEADPIAGELTDLQRRHPVTFHRTQPEDRTNEDRHVEGTSTVEAVPASIGARCSA